MGGLRQDRVGGGKTNAPAAFQPSGIVSRPSTAGSRRSLPLESSFRSQEAAKVHVPELVLPRSRPGSAPPSRPSTAGSVGGAQRPAATGPWQEEGGTGQHFAGRSAPGVGGVVRDSDRVKRDELFSGSSAGSGHGPDNNGSSRASSRPGTAASSRASMSSRAGLPPRAAASRSRPTTAPAARTRQEEERPETASSETSSACEERLLTFQKFFQDKNFAKFSRLKDAFRDVDKDKNGVLGPEEVGMAMASLDIPIDKNIIDRLMSRCDDPEQMSMQEFKDLLWIDDTMETYIDDRKNRRAGVFSLSASSLAHYPAPHIYLCTRFPS